MTYTIQEVAEKVNLLSHTLRYYEKEGILPFIKRDKNGNRIYQESDLAWLELVICLRRTNIPLSDLRAIAQLSKKGSGTINERIGILEAHKKEIEKQQEELTYTLKKISEKITYYKSM